MGALKAKEAFVMKYLTLDTLVSHPKNVRAKTDYAEGSITALAASIKALGLLQSLVVQQLEDGTYGVLAGRRRMMALQQLAEAGDLDDGFKAPCKLIAKDTDHVTALSLAENTMQEPMAPLEEYEAFAAMIAEGETVDSIAATFGTTTRTVKERLRFGLVHGDIREAVRTGTITLDTMKAYASHPCLETQKRVFDSMVEGQPYDHQAWRVRNVLAEQDIRADDPLAVMVMDRYRERGGEIVEGLFEEDTVLKDRTLAEAIRDDLLLEEGERLRAAHGFKWVETRARLDYAELSAYGRIYPQAKELTEEDETRLSTIAERLDEIAGLLEDDTVAEADYGTLSEEYELLEEEADALQNGFLPDHTARAGLVIAPDGHGGFRVEAGLVRTEDYAAWQAEIAEAAEASDVDDDTEINDESTVASDTTPPRIAPPSGSPRTGGDASAKEADPLSLDALSGALRSDLAIERAGLIEAALAEEPDLARDVLTFRLATSTFARGAVGGIGITVQVPWQKHSRPEAQDAGIAAQIEAAREGLDLSFLDAALTDGEKFRAFRAMDEEMKARILAVCVAGLVEPTLASQNPDREPFMDAVAAEAVPDIRAVWRPTAANYWSRVSRGHMLALLNSFGLVAEAEEQRNVKKATLAAYMETLFAQPFATLTEEQREAVESWTPPGMDSLADDREDEDDATNDEEGSDTRESDNEDANLPTYSNLEPGERVVGANADGETVIEDENGVRSVTRGGVVITEPVPVIPGAGFTAPDPVTRRTEFLTEEEAESRAAA